MKIKGNTRLAEEAEMHKLSCQFWRNPDVRREYGLPSAATIQKFTALPTPDTIRKFVKHQAPSVVQIKPLDCDPPPAPKRQVNGNTQKMREMEAASQSELSEMIQLVGAWFKIAPRDIIGRSRNAAICVSRMVFMELAHSDLGYSTTIIGRYLQNRHHSTVVDGLAELRRRTQTEPDLRAAVESLRVGLLHHEKPNTDQPRNQIWLDSNRPAVAVAPVSVAA